jgi:signal peptidase I
MFRFKFTRAVCVLLALFKSSFFCIDVSAQSNYERRVIKRAEIDSLTKYFGTKEKGFNRGKKIERIINIGGGKKGEPYCSYGLIFLARINGVPLFRFVNGSAASWLKWDAVKYYKGRYTGRGQIKRGDIVLFERQGGSGYHAEKMLRWYLVERNKCYTGGFNTRSRLENKILAEGVFPHIRRKEYLIVLDYEKFWNLNDAQIHRLCVELNALYVVRRKQL